MSLRFMFLVLLPWSALAEQEPPVIPVEPLPREEAPAQLEAVMVTGESIERTLVETTSSVQVLGREELAGSSMQDLYDVFARTANVNETQTAYGRSGGFAVRGIADTGVGSTSFGSSSDLASIVIDDVALTGAGNRAGPLELWDVESVELFRGPQSMHLGRNALAGAIVLRTRDPGELFEFRGLARGAEFHGEQQAFAVGGTLAGPFRARLAAQREVLDGSSTNVTREEPAAFRDRNNLRLKLAAQPQDSPFSALLTLTGSQDHRGQPRLSGDPRARQSVANSPEEYRARTRLGSLRLNYQVSEQWEFSAITGAGETGLDQFQDYNGSAEDDGTIENRVDDRTLSQELRAGYTGERLRGVIGLYAARVDSERDTDAIDGAVGFGGPDFYLDGQTDVDDRQQAAALFGEAEWEFFPRWNLIAGTRYDRQTVEFAYDSNYDLAPTRADPLGLGDALGDPFGASLGLPADSAGAGRMRSAVLLPKLGLRRDGEEGLWSVGLTAQRAYRAGGLSVNFARGTFNDVAPEYTWTGELSLRLEALDRRLSTRANLYYTDWRDQQVSVQLSEDPNDSQTENAGRSHLYGFELELDWRFTHALRGFVSAGYSHTQFDQFEVTQYDREAEAYVTVSYAGNRFPGAAPRQGALGLRYGAQQSGLYAQLDASYADGAYRQADNDPQQRSDAYALLNGKLGWKADWGGLYLSGRNLLDRFYVTQRAFGYFAVGEPRTLSLSLEAAF